MSSTTSSASPAHAFETEVVDPLVEEYARTGEARFEFRHFSVAPNETTLAAIAAEAAGRQERAWQYLDTFVRNQALARQRGVDEELLREIAAAVPELDVDQWELDYEAPESEDLVRDDAMLAAELELPAEPAVVVSGPGGQRELIETPSFEQVAEAIEQVSLSAGHPSSGASRMIRFNLRVSSSSAIISAAPIHRIGSVGESSSSRLPR